VLPILHVMIVAMVTMGPSATNRGGNKFYDLLLVVA
jgi:hypothetical protein